MSDLRIYEGRVYNVAGDCPPDTVWFLPLYMRDEEIIRSAIYGCSPAARLFAVLVRTTNDPNTVIDPDESIDYVEELSEDTFPRMTRQPELYRRLIMVPKCVVEVTEEP